MIDFPLSLRLSALSKHVCAKVTSTSVEQLATKTFRFTVVAVQGNPSTDSRSSEALANSKLGSF